MIFKHKAKLSSSKYCDVKLAITLNISLLFTRS